MKRYFRIVVTFFYCFVVMGVALHCSTEKEEAVSQIDGKNVGFTIRNGEKLYVDYCSPCHGVEGDGTGIFFGFDLEPKPPDFTNSNFFQSRTNSDVKSVIEKGSKYIGKSNLCPPWENTMNAEEISSIAGFIRLRFEEDSIATRLK